MKFIIQTYKKQWIILLGTFILIAIYILFLQEDIVLKRIKRNSYGEVEKEYKVYVSGLENKDIEIDLDIQNRKYTKKEIKEIFEISRNIVNKEILFKNKSFDEVYSDLKFPNYIKEYGVEVFIEPQNYELISYSGEVFNENLRSSVDTKLNIILSIDDYKYEYSLSLKIQAFEISDRENLKKALKKYLLEEDEKQNHNEYFELPNKWKNLSIVYKREKDNTVIYLLFFSLILAILTYFSDKEKIKNKKIKDKNKALIEYPEILAKFIVFLEAGLSTRNIWDKLVYDYEKRENKEKIFVYEEMKKVNIKIKAGISESMAYKEFISNIGLRQYTKFISILEQNKRNGLSNIKEILNLECKLAFEERINLAKKEGAKLGTKLLLPVFIMLIIVLFIVLAPAVLNTF